MAGKTKYILDSFALVAYLQGETGMSRIQEVLDDAEKGKCLVYVCIINLGEALYIIEREQGLAKTHEAFGAIQQLAIEILVADNQLVLDAAHIKASHALSYADAFVVVCAQRENGIVLTGDGEFKAVEQIVEIEWLQR